MIDPKALNLSGIKDRDETALREMFEVLLPRVRWWTRNWAYSQSSLDALDAEDLAHEAILKIYTHLDKVPADDPQRLLSYCRAVTRRVVFDSFRRKRRLEMECVHFENEVAEHRQWPPPEDLQELIPTLIEDLSTDDRQLLEGRLEGKTMAELADSLGVSRVSAYQRLRRIIDRLRHRIESERAK